MIGWCVGDTLLGGHLVTEDLETWRAGQAVLLTTAGKFKGLEADALILADVPVPDPNAGPAGFRPEHLYVACSRAKHLLTVCARSEGVRGWFEGDN